MSPEGPSILEVLDLLFWANMEMRLLLQLKGRVWGKSLYQPMAGFHSHSHSHWWQVSAGWGAVEGASSFGVSDVRAQAV